MFLYKVYSNYRGNRFYDSTIIAKNRKEALQYIKSLPTRNNEHYFTIDGRGKRYEKEINNSD